MKKIITSILAASLILCTPMSLEAACTKSCCRGQASTYGSAYSVGTSMVLWGAAMFLGIGLIAILIDPSTPQVHNDGGD